MVNFIFCGNCGSKIEDSKKFCSECGSEVNNKKLEENFIFCSKCGTKFRDSQKFCDKCGSKLYRNQIEEKNYDKIINFTKSSILAIIGSISGIILLIYLSTNILFIFTNLNGIFFQPTISLLASIAGLTGIWLELKSEKVAILQYIVCGSFILFTTGLYMQYILIGIIPAILFFLAAIILLQNKRQKDDGKSGWNDLYSIPIFCAMIFAIMFIILNFIA